jgi:hypothetical protein
MFALTQLLALSVIALSFVSPVTKESDARFATTSSANVNQNIVSVAPFTSVELRNGGKALVKYGASQRVTLMKGSLDCTEVAVVNGDRLIIDTGKKDCPRGYELEIEIITPNIKGLAVANGGLLQSLGGFPGHTAISAAVNQGGVLDIRSINVQSVAAAVRSGGRILARPQASLVASVADGGVITYWGNAMVTSSIKHGGIINKGTAAEADEPVADVNPCLSAVPNVTAVPPVPPVRRSFWW